MSSNYDSIRKDEKRKDELLNNALMLLGQMYSDRTHFIFELLQNAEDAGAAKILFELFKDRLEVKHDGRPFNERDVRGVCGVAEGTKTDDLTQIGKFGIGFKSVYAYTSTPEIHSGDEHFRIEHYVRPYKAPTKVPADPWTTLFVLTFDATDLEPQTAMYEIAERLRNLSARILLFLRNIKEIEYKLPDKTGGVYLREAVSHGQARQVTVIGQNNGQDEDENWLVFERPLSVPDGADTVWVEIGFKLEANSKDRNESIVRIKESPLVVYFPTEKSTRFGFLIQGPYRTTPSRDNIPKDDDWNIKLVKETALLLVDALQSLKKMGLLTVALLNALPIRMDDFPEDDMFYPIVEAVRDALLDQELLPTDDGTFVSARNAKLASAEWLRTLLRHEELRQLLRTENSLKWISGEITERAKHDLWKYIREELKVEEITPDSFARKITTEFLENLPDDWMIKFYQFLAGQEALWKKGSGSRHNPDGPLRKKSFIRLEDGSHVSPFKEDGSPNAFLPPENDTEFPVVKREIVKDEKAAEFLKKLELEEPGAVNEVIKNVLPKYRHNPDISDNKHRQDIKKILKAYETDSQEKKSRLANRLKDTAFIRAENLVLQQIEYKKPEQLYFGNKGLIIYFDGNKDAWFVSSEYEEELYDLFRKLGIDDEIRIYREKPDRKKYVIISNPWKGSEYNKHKRGLNGFDPDIEVDGLEFALTHPTIEKSKFIWNQIAIPNSDCIRGIVESSTRLTYENSEKKEQISQNFGLLLRDCQWLPDKQGNFHKPSEIMLNDLPKLFDHNEELANQLGMKKDVVAKLAEEAGVSLDALKLAQKLETQPPEIREKIISLLQKGSERNKPVFPTKISPNPDRRKKQLTEQNKNAPEKEYEQRNRSVRTTANSIDKETYLRNAYTNDDGQMVCQICKEEMPFRKRDGEYYFEAVEALSRDYFAKEHEAQFLALCPLCAAKYKEFIKLDDNAMESLKNVLINSKDTEISLKLGDENASIKFVETHFIDIKTILKNEI